MKDIGDDLGDVIVRAAREGRFKIPPHLLGTKEEMKAYYAKRKREEESGAAIRAAASTLLGAIPEHLRPAHWYPITP